jgi:hypothetical protein
MQIAESMEIDGMGCLQNIDSVLPRRLLCRRPWRDCTKPHFRSTPPRSSSSAKHSSSRRASSRSPRPASTGSSSSTASSRTSQRRSFSSPLLFGPPHRRHLRAEYAGRGELSERQQTLHLHLRHLKTIVRPLLHTLVALILTTTTQAEEFKVAVVVTNQVQAVPDSMSIGGPIVKACGGPIMAHSTTTKLFLRKARGQQKKASLTHSPFMPPGDCLISISAAGIVDVSEEG